MIDVRKLISTLSSIAIQLKHHTAPILSRKTTCRCTRIRLSAFNCAVSYSVWKFQSTVERC